MGSHGALAFAHVAPKRDGAISTWKSSAARNGVMSAIDAHHDGGMPLGQWIPGLQEGEAGAGTPSGSPFSEGPLTTALPLRFNPGGSSLQLPLFINNSSTSRRHLSSSIFPDQNTSRPNIEPHADCLPLFHTFYLSPSASRSSIASGLWSYDLSNNSEETQSTMPGPTFDTPADQFLLLDTTDYFSTPTCASTDAVTNSTEFPPPSAGSGRSEETTSPLAFARWARRPHHHYEHISSHQTGQEARKLKGPGRGPAERKSSRKNSPKRSGRSRSSSVQRHQAQARAVPQMTREEFEALPLAIQRKYFSTLERLRFAQESGLVDGISQHYDDITNFRRQKPHQNRSTSEHIVNRVHLGSVLESHLAAADSSPSYADAAEATQDAAFSREKQVALTKRLRASVILDAADEAIYKLNQQASRRNPPSAIDPFNPPLSPSQDSMESRDGHARHLGQHDEGGVPQSFYDSFRWLDEEEDLDLRLFLDDYHANLREGMLTTKQRPSFRRRMSVSKIPFGRRSSVSSSRPGTKDTTTTTSPIPSSTGSVSNPPTHTRRKSRALSLIMPKHAPQPSITGFDPAAAHYQDPEARLKLRVYLASPQKFDEAVEFGFPAADVLSASSALDGDATGRYRGHSKPSSADGSSNMRSFLVDEDDGDNVSLSSDQPSLGDPDSPKTPEPFEHRPVGLRHTRFASADVLNGRDFAREIGGYVQVPASSREMTLRMTLTRPDLRAHEDEMYGWQKKQVYQQHSRRPTALASLVAETSGAYAGIGPHKDSMDRLGGIDRPNAVTTEKGVMKRFWNRMRRA